MIVNVWLFAKEGSDRVYTRTVQPDEGQVAILRKDGFKVYRAVIHLPVDFDDTRMDAVIGGEARLVESVDAKRADGGGDLREDVPASPHQAG